MSGSPWYALVAPAGTPKEIVNRLNREMNEVLRQPEIKAQFAKQGVKIITSGVDDTGKFIRAEIQRVGRILAETGVKAN
jgi:tripartite-type tricarboxylate transporter receptor subunit TctC